MSGRARELLARLGLLVLGLLVLLPRLVALDRDPPERLAPFAVRDEGYYSRNLRCLEAIGQPAVDGWLIASSSLPHSALLAASTISYPGSRQVAYRLVSAASIALAAVLLAGFLWWQRSPAAGLASLALFACDPLLLASSLHATPYAPALLALVVAVLLAAGADAARPRDAWVLLVLAGFAAGIAAVTKLQLQALLALITETLLLGQGRAPVATARRIGAYLLGAALPLLFIAVVIGRMPWHSRVLAERGLVDHFGSAPLWTLLEHVPDPPPLLAHAPFGWIALLALPALLACAIGRREAGVAGRLDRVFGWILLWAIVLPLPLAQHYPRYALPLALALGYFASRSLSAPGAVADVLEEAARSRRRAPVLAAALALPLAWLVRALEERLARAPVRLDLDAALIGAALGAAAVLALRQAPSRWLRERAAPGAGVAFAAVALGAASAWFESYHSGERTLWQATGALRGRFQPGEVVLAGDGEVLLLEAPVCPAAARSFLALEAGAEAIVLRERASGRERARIRHALLRPWEQRALADAYPEIAARLEIALWVHSSWDGEVALLAYRPSGVPPRQASRQRPPPGNAALGVEPTAARPE